MTLFLFAIPASEVAALGINKTSVTLTKGYSTNLKITGASGTVKWSSSNKNIATVTKSGKVTGKATGTAYITAKVDGATLQCTVKVVLGKLSSSASTANLNVGDQKTVTITAKGSHAVKATSSNTSVAYAKWASSSFSNDKAQLRIIARNPGTATIKVYMTKDSRIYTTINVTVGGGSTLSASPTSVSVNAGSSSSVAINCSNPYNLNYSMSDQNIATYSVSSQTSGRVNLTITGRQAGTAYLTVSDYSTGKSVRITINVLGGNLTVSPSTVNVNVNSSQNITVNTSNPGYLTYQFSDNNKAYYSITNQGTSSVTLSVTGREAGTTYLTITDSRTNKSQRVTINVGGGLTISPTTLSLSAGRTGTITVNADNAYYIDVQSSNSAVATAYSNATSSNRATVTVNAIASGSATITITDRYTGRNARATITVSGSSLAVSPTSLNLAAYGTGTLTVSNCSNPYNIPVNSSNSSIDYGTVSTNYSYSNRANITVTTGYATGTCTLTITDNSTRATAYVTVTVGNSGTLTVSKSSVSMNAGTSTTVTANSSNAYQITVSSSNSTVASAYVSSQNASSANIVIYGNTSGTATITVSDRINTRYITVNVSGGSSGLSLSTTNVSLNAGTSQTITATSSNMGSLYVYSSNDSVATAYVSSTSYNTASIVIRANSTSYAASSCTITVTDSYTGQSKTVYVSVNTGNSGQSQFYVNTSNVNLSRYGSSQSFTVTSGYTGNLQISSSDTSVASIYTSNYGTGVTVYVYPQNVGTATIYIYDRLTGQQSSVYVTVTN
ncbi:MAG: Ig-like domain-containing protein [Oscillospiraceae bacterium]|nr:Ig-like domain-containing protein [Oscillospiraceae bacterium]